MLYTITKFFLRMAFHIHYNLRYEGRKAVPKGEAFVVVSNHRTNVDPPLIAAGCRGRHTFMAKEELFRKKIFAWFIRMLGAFPVSSGKGDMAVIDTSVENLNSGKNLIIFPEGTRSKDGKIGRGHTGAALIAARSGKRLLPVGIIFDEKLKFRTKLTIKFGEPIDPKDYVDSQEEPNPRQLVKLKNKYMEEIKKLVEGEPENNAPAQEETPDEPA